VPYRVELLINSTRLFGADIESVPLHTQNSDPQISDLRSQISDLISDPGPLVMDFGPLSRDCAGACVEK